MAHGPSQTSETQFLSFLGNVRKENASFFWDCSGEISVANCNHVAT